MKKILILLAVSVLGIAVGLIFNGPRNQKTENVGSVNAEPATNEYVSASTSFAPRIGTNIASKPFESLR